MTKNGFFHSHLLCASNNAVIDESEQLEIISQKRSFDSNESSTSLKNHSQLRKYVSPSQLNQSSVEDLWNSTANKTTTTEDVLKSCNAVDLDDEISSDISGVNCIDRSDGKINDHGGIHVACEDGDIVSLEPSKEALLVAWSHVVKQMEEEIAHGIVPVSSEVLVAVEDDERTQGSDNSKCSFGYEKPIMKETSKLKKKKMKHTSSKSSSPISPPTAEHSEEILKSLFETDHQPVLDKTPSKVGTTNVVYNDEQFDNTTCTWSESADSTIPTVIYIRRDVPPVVPEDEALGQNYTVQQSRAIYEYTNRMKDPTTTGGSKSVPSKSYLMKGLRYITMGAMGSKEVTTTAMTPEFTKIKKIHLDDDASEAFQQTLIDI